MISGVGITKAIYLYSLFSNIFLIVEIPVTCWISSATFILFHNQVAYTLPAKSMDYSENPMETLAFDILIYCKWLGINHK